MRISVSRLETNFLEMGSFLDWSETMYLDIKFWISGLCDVIKDTVPPTGGTASPTRCRLNALRPPHAHWEDPSRASV